MAGFNVELRDSGVRDTLRGVARRLDDFTVPMKLIGVHMTRSVQKNFDAGGRPKRWIPSKRAKAEGGKTLLDHGLLAGSITPHAERDRLRIGTNLVYGAIHQFGGEIEQARRSAAGRRGERGRGRTVKTGTIITMPARPFLLVQGGDLPILRGILTDYVRGRS